MDLETRPSNRLCRGAAACGLAMVLWCAASWSNAEEQPVVVAPLDGEAAKEKNKPAPPKPETPQPEALKTETPKAAPPKVEAPKAEPPQPEPAKAEPQKTEAPPADPAPFSYIELKDLPEFKDEIEERASKTGRVHTHGLVSTINFSEYKEPEADGEEKIKLPKTVTGFRDDLDVRVLWQPQKAPLAIVLLGFYGKTGSKLGKTWIARLQAAGCHVLIFDSVFHVNFNQRTGHGMPGNLKEEAKAVAKLVDVFLTFRPEKDPRPVREKVSEIRLLGTSYGGLLALHLLREPQAAKWPVTRTLILSAPVRMQSAANYVDDCYRVDRPKFEISLTKLMGGFKPDGTQPTERECALMRAGIGYDFYASLEEILSRNEQLYMPGLFQRFREQEEAGNNLARLEQRESELKERQEKEQDALKKNYEAFKNDKAKKEEYKARKKDLEDRHKVETNDLKRKYSDAACWTFKDFVEQMCAPYWKIKPDEVWAQGDLATMLKDAPGAVQVFLAADDPLNKPEELKALQAGIHNPRLIVLPHGGHLGYVGTRWCDALIKKFFTP